MTTSDAEGMCRAVDENIGDIIDGVADNGIFDHMAGCERCRDARYDAEQAILLACDAGLDYRMPDDLTAQLMAALDARPKTASIIPAAVGEKLGEKLASVRQALVRPDLAASNQGASAEASPPASRARRQPPARPSARWTWLSLAAALGLGLLWVSARRDPDQPAPKAPVGLAGAWQGQVLQVERAFGSASGLSECARGTQVCHPLAAGDTAHPGMRLETDGLTRARVRLGDGSVLALDRQTRFELDPNHRRRGRLHEGNLVAEIEKVAESEAPSPTGASGSARDHAVVIDLPTGRAEVLGTKFSLRAEASEARVEVSRGSVKLIDARDQAVLVQAGEAGVIGTERTPRVESVLDLGKALAWSSAAFEERPAATLDRGALGELIAKRPRDGRELSGAVRLKEHHIKARIVDNIARTEVEEIFENSANEVLEGIYRFPLPPGAQIERLALEVDGKLVEGAFVDRERAAAIWRGAVVNAGGKKPAPNEDIVWVPGPWRDPALLEWQRGSRFELRIFPIPARGSRRVVLAYTEVLPPSEGERAYVYPLPRDPSGSTRIARFTAEVQVRGLDLSRGVQARGYAMKPLSGSPEVARLAFDQNDFVPSGDLTVAFELASAQAELRAWAYQPDRAGPEPSRASSGAIESLASESRPVGTRPEGPLQAPAGALAGHSDEALGIPADAPFVALALRPALPLRARHEPREYVLVVDTSRSMIGENYRRAVEVVARIIREMDRNDRVSVLACDASCSAAPGGGLTPGDAAADAAARFLDGIEPEGASDLAFAVAHAAAVGARARAARADAADRRLRVVYVGDGTPTVGPIHPALLARAVAEALPRGASLTAVGIGSDADRSALRTVTRAGGGVSLAFSPGQSAEDVAFAVLGATYGHALDDARIELPSGLVRVMPADLGSIAAGAEELLVMRMTAPRVQGEVVLTGEVAGERFERHYPLELVATTGAANAFVPRLYAAVAIGELEGSIDEAARRRSIELSTRYNVASRYTSLLVLESPAMFDAFGLDNRRSAPEWTGELESDKREATSDELAYVIADGDAAHGSVGASGGIGSSGGLDAPSSGAPRSAAKAATPGAQSSRAEAWTEGAAREERSSTGASDELAGEPGYARPPPATAPAPSMAPPAEPEARRGPAPDGALPFDPSSRGPTLQPFELPQRRMIPMRRVWDRVARIETPPGALLGATPERRSKLEMRLHDNPDSRDALRSLYVFDFKSGDLDKAAREAEHWSEKDPLDVDALTARADLAAQRGQRDAAIRILGSVVDVRPGDYKSQWRLARLHRWAGNPERGCRHSLAVAQLMLRDAKLVSEAVGCAREVGQSRTAEDLLAAIDPALRPQVEQLVQKRRPHGELSGDFRVQASWEGSENDIDVVIIHPDGYRVSWLGAPTRAVISASDVLSVQREGLALRGAEPGQYAVELVRASSATGAVRGSVQLAVADAQRNVPFVMEGERLRIALVTLKSEARLVPLDAWE